MMFSTKHHPQRSHTPHVRMSLLTFPLSLSLFLSFLSFFLSFNISSSNLFSPFTRRGTERDMKGIVNQKQTPSYPLSKYQIRLLSSIPSLSSFLKRNSRRNSQIIVMYPLAINSYPFSASSPLFSANSGRI